MITFLLKMLRNLFYIPPKEKTCENGYHNWERWEEWCYIHESRRCKDCGFQQRRHSNEIRM